MKRSQPEYFSAENPPRLCWRSIDSDHLPSRVVGDDDIIPAVEVSRATTDSSLVLSTRMRVLLFVGGLGGSMAGALLAMWAR